MAKKTAPTQPSAAIAGGYPSTPEDIAREEDYKATSDLRTLHEAHQIKKDPKRHARAKKKATEMMAATNKGAAAY